MASSGAEGFGVRTTPSQLPQMLQLLEKFIWSHGGN